MYYFINRKFLCAPFRKAKVMRAIGLLACHSTELREDVPVIEVSWFDLCTYLCFSHYIQVLSLDPEVSFVLRFHFLSKRFFKH